MQEEERYNCKGKKELFEFDKCVKCKYFCICLNEKAENENAALDLYVSMKIEKGEL